jgi:acyl-homoserine lactone acylase PvdQ
VDLADVENAGMVITTGQSGNPLARRYRDHAERWWNGELFTVPLSRERVREVAVLRLVPR